MPEYDELPFHIQEETMKRLPVKSLLQFRSVSKAWKSLIDSSEFIAAHSLHGQTRPQHLLVSYEDQNYVSYIDDDTFPRQRSLMTLPISFEQLLNPIVVGSSQGLVCLYGSHPNLRNGMAVLWNPSIRKLIVVDVPGETFVSFGVCPVTSDPKIVSITPSSRDVPETSYSCEFMVYTLGSGRWRSLSNMLTKPLGGLWSAVVTDRFIYWRAELPTHNMIMSFDVTNENFELIDLPDSLTRHNAGFWSLFKLKESIAITEYMGNICTVWMMEHGVRRLFTKLFTLETPHKIRGFRKNGVPIMDVTNQNGYDYELVVYEPNSEQSNVLEINLPPYPFHINSYMETLLLLGRSDCTSY